MTATQRWVILLAVYGLFLAIGIASLGAVLGWVPHASEVFKKWSVAVLFVDVAAAGVAVFKTQFQMREARAFVNVGFGELKPPEVDLDHDRCEFVVYGGDNSIKKKGRVSVSKGAGGWQCQFSWPAEPEDTACLTLTEHSGRTWKIQDFSPTTVSQGAIKVA